MAASQKPKNIIETPVQAPFRPVPVIPAVLPETILPSYELPSQYGDDKIVLMVRDPWWLYAYWEVTDRRQAEVLDQIQRQGLMKQKNVLRVYDITGGSIDHPRSSFDIEVAFLTGNWYIDVGIPDREWMVELGFRASDGRFFPLVRSNAVRTPRFGVSDVLDEEWMLPDETYWKLFGLSGGLADRKSSLDVRDILERYLKSIVSSDMSSFSQADKMLRNEQRLDVSAKILGGP